MNLYASIHSLAGLVQQKEDLAAINCQVLIIFFILL
jgi:hypothetical protein